MYDIKVGGYYTQQHINCGDIVIFVPDDLAYGRGGIWIILNNIQQHSTIQQQYLILDIIPLFELSGTKTIGNSTI